MRRSQVDVTGRNDLTRHDGKVYCRRCCARHEEDQGRWRRVRMSNGVKILQFICSGCDARILSAAKAK